MDRSKEKTKTYERENEATCGAFGRDEIKMRNSKFMAYLIQALLHSMSPKTLVWGYHCRRPVLYH